MTPGKRLFDLVIAVILAVLLAPVILITALALLILDGRPVFYVSERMTTPTRGFKLIKFRTMKPAAENGGVSGGDKAARITRMGAFLRRSRLDEVPQLWNVIRGDISLVGPRPPLRQYVERFPEVYGPVLRSRPGVTGLASIYFHAHEERLLARSSSPAETDEIYCRVCVPRKARLDLIYQARRGICMDAGLLVKTVFKGLR